MKSLQEHIEDLSHQIDEEPEWKWQILLGSALCSFHSDGHLAAEIASHLSDEALKKWIENNLCGLEDPDSND